MRKRLKKEYCNVVYSSITTLVVCLKMFTDLEFETLLAIFVGVCSLTYCFLDVRARGHIGFVWEDEEAVHGE